MFGRATITLGIDPHSSSYVDVAYYYQPSIMVCLLVCRSLTVVSPAKAVEPIDMPFGLKSWMGPRNYVLDGGSDPPWGNYRGKWGGPL